MSTSFRRIGFLCTVLVSLLSSSTLLPLVSSSSIFSSSASSAAGISTSTLRHLAPLNAFSIKDYHTKAHLKTYLPPKHLLSTPSHFHTLTFEAVETKGVGTEGSLSPSGFHQPFPNRIVLEFDAFDRHFHLALDLLHNLYEKNSVVTVEQDGKVVEQLQHELLSYQRRVNEHEWATVTLSHDGTFHAVIHQEGEIYQANPILSHQGELLPNEWEEIQGQASRKMVIFRHSDLIDQEKNHVCGAVQKPANADSYLEQGGGFESAEALVNATFQYTGISTRKLLQLSQAPLAAFQNCYPGSSSPNKVSVGIAVDYGYYQVWGSSSAVQARIASMISTANIVYSQQLNIFLTVNTVVIQSAGGGPQWNLAPPSIGASCAASTTTNSISNMLNWFSAWKYANYPNTNTLWHQLTACYPPPGTVGLAWIGVLCNQYYSTGVSSHNSQGWLTVAHEIGHNFGAQHTFQLGQGTTGSIMDYCDGKLPCGTGPTEFHPTYTQPQMCSQIAAVKSNTQIQPYCVAAYSAQCGNGVIETGEQCDDNSGCCVNCQFKAGAQCSGTGSGCCNSNCQFAPTSTLCESGQGFCSNGQCQTSICNSYSGIKFCGLKSSNPCRQQCQPTAGGSCTDAYSVPNLAIGDGTVCNTAPYSTCSNGNCVPVNTGASTVATVTYSWTPSAWSACSCTGSQTRTFNCVGSDGSQNNDASKCGSQPSSSQGCAIPSSCISYQWNAPVWSACSVDCGGGTQTSPQVCSIVGSGQVVSNSLCSGSGPATSQSCNTQACPTYWSYTSWSQCSASCGNSGVQSRTATCYQTQNGKSFVVASSVCSSGPDVTTQPCNQTPCPTYSWVYSTWSSCSASCGGGTQTNQAHCVSSSGATVDNSYCSGNSLISQPCNTQACPVYGWVTGDWGSCSLSCGGGVQSRSLTCVDSTSGKGVINTYCTLTPPPSTQSCNTQACATYSWSTGIWGSCSQTCGGGTQSRTVNCINNANGQVASASSCNAAILPPSTQPCNSQACLTTSSYNWFIGSWGTCSSLCNGLQVRFVGCMPVNSFTLVSTIYCTGTRPSSTQQCNTGLGCYELNALPNPNNASWSVSEWGPCTAICGGGYRNRTLTCVNSNGGLLSNDQCPSPAPVVALNDVCGDYTCPTFWYTSDFGPCTASCGGGMQTRSVECRVVTAPDGPAVDETLCQETKPSLYASCGTNPCPSYVAGDWSDCSSPCGYGVQTRSLTCMSYDNLTLDDSACVNAPLLTTQQVCSNYPCPHWHREDWSECSKPCGGGIQTRDLVCRMPHDGVYHGTKAPNATLCPTVGAGDTGDGAGTAGVPSGKPPAQQVCNLEVCPAYYWLVKETGTCSADCGGGKATGTVVCVNGADSSQTVDDSLCFGTKPSSIYNCNPQPCPLYDWFPYTNWTDCNVFCGQGTQTRIVKCRNMHPTSNLPLDYDLVDDSLCTNGADNAANPPPTSQVCDMGEEVCYGSDPNAVNGKCDTTQGTCICRLGYGGQDCSIPPSISNVETNAIYYSQGVPLHEYLQITWESTGDLPHLSILLLRKSDADWPFASYIATSLINTNQHVWVVGDEIPDLEMGDDYYIRVWFGDQLYADSDVFSIADPCAYVYCGTQGMCSNGQCECVPGYSGPTCAIGPCERAHCDHLNSACDNSNYASSNVTADTIAVCPCLNGYTGAQCKTPPDCSSHFCANGGDLTQVVVHSDGTTTSEGECGICSCMNRWTGSTCEECSLTCQNGGKADSNCTTCNCPAGYFGSTCDCRYYSLTIPLAIADTSFLSNSLAAARFQRTLANDLAIAAGAATGVTVQIVVDDVQLDPVSGNVIATVYFSLECILSSAMEGGFDSSPFGLTGGVQGVSTMAQAGPAAAVAASITTSAVHYNIRYATASSAGVDGSSASTPAVLLPGQQGSLSQAFQLLIAAFANSDSLLYHGVVSGTINKNSQIIATDPTGQDVVPTVTMAQDPFVARRRGPGEETISKGGIIALIVTMIIVAIAVTAGIGLWLWARVRKQQFRRNQDMELKSGIRVNDYSVNDRNKHEPPTPFTPYTPHTGAQLVEDRGQYQPPLKTETESRRESMDKDDSVGRAPLVKSSDVQKSRIGERSNRELQSPI